MKRIQTVNTWTPNGNIEITHIQVRIIGDDLSRSMQTLWEIGYIKDDVFKVVQQGNCTISDTEESKETPECRDYTNLGRERDINEDIYFFVAKNLNLTIEK